MKRIAIAFAVVVSAGLLFNESAQAAARTWLNLGPDFNTPANWTGGVPGANDVGLFDTAPVMQPNLSASLTIAGLRFAAGSSGYNLTSSAGAVLTLNGVSTTGTSGTTTASASAIRNDNVTGTTTISADLNLAPSTFVSTIFQEAADGGTLILNGVISQTGVVALSLKNGTIQLNNANTYSGGTSVDAAGTVVVIGNNSALGTGTVTINNSSTLQAGGGARTISNGIVLGADTTIGGANALTVNGTVTSSGSNSRSLIVNNAGGLTLNGNVFLSESNTLARSLGITGSSSVVINGVVANNNVGNTLASSLRYSGTGTLTLNNGANTYSGGTSVNTAGGTVIANADGALGSGNVSLTAASVTLTLQNGAVNNYINNNASLSIVTGSTLNLNFTGLADTVGNFFIDGVQQAVGVHNATTDPGFIFGTGSINNLALVPEPATYMLLGFGVLLCAQQFRRKKS